MVLPTFGVKTYFGFIYRKDADFKSLDDAVDAALLKIKKDGRMAKLQEKWFGTSFDTPDTVPEPNILRRRRSRRRCDGRPSRLPACGRGESETGKGSSKQHRVALERSAPHPGLLPRKRGHERSGLPLPCDACAAP